MGGMDAEVGGHRVQRISRTEKRGRVHSSTVTVAVLSSSTQDNLLPFLSREEGDFKVDWYSGTVGAGGQNHQKTQNCARVTHVPTGIVKTAQSRSRRNSLQNAMSAIAVELDRLSMASDNATKNASRTIQVGTGERSDRRRTWSFQRDVVDDFRTGRQMRCTDAMRGKMDRLW